MRKLALLLLLALTTGLPVARGFVYENLYELQADGDFDGDGRTDLIIVDKLTGNYRVGYQVSPGNYTWVSTRASGVPGVTGLGIGRLSSLAYDSLAVAAPDANRLTILDANSSSAPGLPIPVFLPSLGPNAVGVIDIGGLGNTNHHDLYIASMYNGTSAFRETMLRNDGTTNRTVIADNPLTLIRERLNSILLHTNRVPRLALMERKAAPTYDNFRVYDLSNGVPVLNATVLTDVSLQPQEYVSGQFAVTNPYTQVLFYPPGAWYFSIYQFAEPSTNNYVLNFVNSYSLTNFIDRMFTLPGSNDTKLLFFYTNGTSAAVYTFNGTNVPQVSQQIEAPAGQHFTGAGVYGKAGMVLFSAPRGRNTSSQFTPYKWNGSNYTQGAVADLPNLSSYSASGNVMQFLYEPFVTNNPVLLRVNNAGDWASSPQIALGNISARSETFLGATQGLANPANVPLGAAHPLAAFGLANQYSNMISLFSFNPPAGDKVSDVTISPAAGRYPTAIQLRFTAVNATDLVWFRIGGGNWIQWSNSLLARVFTNLVVQYYGQPSGNQAKSAIKTASYTFTSGPSTLDSDGDGVPDYVEVALGLNPNGGRDSDGDGYSDLEELLHGKNPLSNTSVPTNFPHLDDQAAFDLAVTPRPWDGFSNVMSLSATGTALRVYDFQGSLLSLAVTTNANWPFARLTNIAIVAEDRLVTFATEPHYNILTTNTDKTVGREMLGLTPVPPLVLPPVPYTYGGGNLGTEATNWINSAQATLNNLPRSLLTNSLTVNKTLSALLFELKTAQLLRDRGTNWWTNMTLFPFRVSDVARTNPTQPALLSLEDKTTNQAGYKLQTAFATISNLVETSGSPSISGLQQVVQDIYRIDSLLNNSNPATFASPVDEIRYFLWNGTFDSNYLYWATSSGQFGPATAGATTILASVSPRPTTNLLLVVRPDTAGGACRILDVNGGPGTFALYNSSLLVFSFPDNFNLLPGSLVEISGYTDVTNSLCGYRGIQVTSALLCSVPIATDTDGDGNLLIDTWEKQFYGDLNLANPFGDSDGDGYSNIQEMLEGSDPRDVHGIPTAGVASFAAPVLTLSENGGQVELFFQWPASYIGRFNFGVRHTDAIGNPFITLGAVTGPVNVSGNQFKMTFAVPPTAQHYYYLTVGLH
jgi:hypothetical protein